MKAVKLLIPLLALTGLLGAATLHLKKRAIVPDRRARLESPGPRWTAGRSHLILQYRQAVTEEMLQELSARGAYVVGALPDFGVVLSAPDDFSLDTLDVEWAGRLEMEDKISPALQNVHKTAAAWFVAEFFPDVDMAEARRLAEAAGFQVQEHRDLLQTHLLLFGSIERLRGLAQWDEVAYVFPASRALIQGVRVRHCAGALTSGGLTPMYVTSGTGWPKDSSGQVTLSYVFGSITPKLDPSQATQEILRALNVWSPYAPIKFVAGQTATGPRTLAIGFATKDHGDGFPFDGPGGVLAHTFYPAPPNPESIAGDMHLDGDEDWHIGANIDLFTVAAHEAGHALGLAHVDNPGALMYPYYRLGTKIGADDIAGLQSLYGSPQDGAVPVPATPSLTLTLSTPLPGTTTIASSIALTGTTAAADGTARVTWQTDHGASGAATGAAKWSTTAVPLVIGSNTITVTATDRSHKAVQSVRVTRAVAPITTPTSVDRVPPTISIASPSGNIVSTTAGTIDLKGSASDNVGIAKVTWQSGAGSGTMTGTTTWSVTSVPLLVGDNTITVRAYDTAGNSAWRSTMVIRR